MNTDQFTFPLTHVIVNEQKHSMVCIPDRTTADCELAQVRREYGDRLIKFVIRKDKRSKHNPKAEATYTLSYVTRESKTVAL